MILKAFWQHKIDIKDSLRVEMSQIGCKMSKFWGEFVIVSTDLRITLLNFVATDVYALFKNSIRIKLQHDVQNKGGGGGGNGFLNNV